MQILTCLSWSASLLFLYPREVHPRLRLSWAQVQTLLELASVMGYVRGAMAGEECASGNDTSFHRHHQRHEVEHLYEEEIVSVVKENGSTVCFEVEGTASGTVTGTERVSVCSFLQGP